MRTSSTGSALPQARRRRERGSATILVVGLLGVIATLTVSTGAYLSAVITSHRARAAADLAGIAGATRLAEGATVGDSCRAAATTAASNGATLVQCQAEGATLLVGLEVRMPGRLPGSATARARAGAEEEEGLTSQAEGAPPQGSVLRTTEGAFSGRPKERPQDDERTGLVQGLVAVAALRRLHARRAPVHTRAARHDP